MARPSRPNRRISSGLSLTNPNELDSLLVPPPSRRWEPPAIRSPLLEVEDRRTFYPSPVRPVRSLRKWSVPSVAKQPLKAKRQAKPVRLADRLPWRFSFAGPRFVAVCIRRAQRREVLHAFKKTGKGSGGGRKRRNALSNTRC